MDKRLRQLLRDHGVSEEACDRLERNDAPAKNDELRKAAEATVEANPTVRQCRDLLAKIQEDVAAIKKTDGQYWRPILGVQTTNGHAIDLPNFLKGLQR
jgi:hypothetical protein